MTCENANVFKEIPVDFNCLILCVKNGMFFGRKMTEKIDWKLVEKVDKIEDYFINFKDKVEKKFDKIEKKVEGIEKKIDSLFSLLQNK